MAVMKFKDKENANLIHNIEPYETEKGWAIKIETQHHKGYATDVMFRMPMKEFGNKIFKTKEETEKFIESLADKN